MARRTKRHRICDPEVRILEHYENYLRLKEAWGSARSVQDQSKVATEMRQVLDAIRKECQPFDVQAQLERADEVLRRLEAGIRELPSESEALPEITESGEIH